MRKQVLEIANLALNTSEPTLKLLNSSSPGSTEEGSNTNVVNAASCYLVDSVVMEKRQHLLGRGPSLHVPDQNRC